MNDHFVRQHYELRFRVEFMEKRGMAFQDLFADIMEKRYPADFVRVQPWGREGDWKCDGYLRSRRTLFQCYAPKTLNMRTCETKVDDDFEKALSYWKQHFDLWVFVHGERDGLPAPLLVKLLKLSAAHAPLKLVPWGFQELLAEVLGLPEHELASLFGPAPSRAGMLQLGLADLEPVLDQIGRLPPEPAPDLRPVPSDKLTRNMLSRAVVDLLTLGMSQSQLVRRYFTLEPQLHDQVAEAFRQKYRSLRESPMAPDDIFLALQSFAGGAERLGPQRECAVLAVMAFFFEECDIFERALPGDDEAS